MTQIVDFEDRNVPATTGIAFCAPYFGGDPILDPPAPISDRSLIELKVFGRVGGGRPDHWPQVDSKDDAQNQPGAAVRWSRSLRQHRGPFAEAARVLPAGQPQEHLPDSATGKG